MFERNILYGYTYLKTFIIFIVYMLTVIQLQAASIKIVNIK